MLCIKVINNKIVINLHLDKYIFIQYKVGVMQVWSILKNQRKSPELQSFLNLRKEYFRPVDQFLPNEIAGEEAFRNETGLGRKWLAKMEEWKIINPEARDGLKVYSQADITLGKLVVKMDSIGLGPKDGFDPDARKHYMAKFQGIAVMSQEYYIETALGNL